MRYTINYLKKSVVPILIVIGLLVVQAMSDLALPSYTSDIVNVGIQQRGIESAAPDAIRESSMEDLKLFLSDADWQTVQSHYRLIDSSSLTQEKYEQYLEQYPAIETDTLYVRDTADADTINELSTLLSKPMLIVYTLRSDNAEVQSIRDQLTARIPGVDANVDLVSLLAGFPAEQRAQIMGAIEEKIGQIPESIMEQTALLYVQGEYQSIGMDTDRLQTRYIFVEGGKMLLLALVSMAAAIAVGFIASRIAAGFGRDLRGGVVRKVLTFSNAEMDRFSTASLITRSTNDIQQIQLMLVMLIRIVCYAPIIGVGGVVKVVGTNSSMTWILGLAVALIVVAVGLLFAFVMPRFKKLQDLIDRLNRVTREILTGLPVIRAFSTQKHEEKRFDGANRDLMKTQLFVNRVMSLMMPLMMLLMNGVTLLIVYNGAYGIDSGTMQVGDMMAFIQYAMQIIMSFLLICSLSIMLPRAVVSLKRINEVLGTQPEICDPQGTDSFDAQKKGYVEFKNVSFRYPGADEDVLSNISFVAQPGQTTAFIGSTGSGKSTLINLIPRFYDATEGEVLVDGQDVRKVTQHDLRARIGYVPQKGVLFSGTIESNIKYGRPDATDGQMRQAAAIAQATEFIESKPEGYATEISEGGTNVSGGQKQRLSIARAIAVDPEIYIFDDSFSALDFKTDAVLRKALKEETDGKTVLIVAQRISTILDADQIIVLDEGKIAGRGTHRELMENCEIYQQIALSQLSKEELLNG